MFVEILLWLSMNAEQPPDKYPHYPPAADVKRFPSRDACLEQRVRWEQHHQWLEQMEAGWPESRERFAVWKDQASHAAFLWEVLREAVEVWDWQDEESKRARLDRYRWWIGEDFYREGWTPPLLPPNLHAEPEKTTAAAKMADGQ